MFATPRQLLVAIAVAGFAGAASAQSLVNPRTPPPDRDPRSAPPAAADYRQYEYGKEIFAVKLGCKSCPMGAKPLDADEAQRFFLDAALWEGLDDKEYEAVSVYLKQRFGLL